MAQLLAEEIIPIFGVPEALLSDRGTNFLSSLVLDLCKLLGIEKLNTTAYHPQCSGIIEHFNWTLKGMLRKHAAKFGKQWDRYLHGLLWAYRNTPHKSTEEKPSFLLFGIDLWSPTEAALLPPTPPEAGMEITDYRQEIITSLSSAREEAAKAIQEAQLKYKKQYDRTQKPYQSAVGDSVLVHFPQEESGAGRKLARAIPGD